MSRSESQWLSLRTERELTIDSYLINEPLPDFIQRKIEKINHRNTVKRARFIADVSLICILLGFLLGLVYFAHAEVTPRKWLQNDQRFHQPEKLVERSLK